MWKVQKVFGFMSLETYAILTGYYSLVRLVFILAALAGALIWHVRTNTVMIEIVVIKCVIISAALIRIGFIYRELIIGVHTRCHKKLKMFRMLCTISAVVGTICLPFVVILAVVFERHSHLIWIVPAFLIFILFQKYDYACIESLYLIFKAEHQAVEQQKFEEMKQAMADTLSECDSQFTISGETVINVVPATITNVPEKF